MQRIMDLDKILESPLPAKRYYFSAASRLRRCKTSNKSKAMPLQKNANTNRQKAGDQRNEPCPFGKRTRQLIFVFAHLHDNRYSMQRAWHAKSKCDTKN